MNWIWTLLIVVSGAPYWRFKDLKLRHLLTNATQVITNKNPSKDARFNRRITTFQKANWRQNVSQRLPVELIHSIAEYIHYDWMNLLDVIPDSQTGSRHFPLEHLRRYLLHCATAGQVIFGYPYLQPNPIGVDSAGNIIEINLEDWYLHDSALGDLSKLPPTLQTLKLRSNFLTKLDTKALPRGLKLLDLSKNRIGCLDIKNLPKGLTDLNIGVNPLKDVDFSALPIGLKRLGLRFLGLKTVDLQSFPDGLEILNLNCNPLQKLNATSIRCGELKQILLWGQRELQIELPEGCFTDPSNKSVRLPCGTWIDRRY